MSKFNLIIFDMDGVLVDVSQSYRLAIKKTAEFFLGKMIDNNQIDALKLSGGYNDDYDCTDAILRNHGRVIPREIIIKKFQEYYLNKNYKGLIGNERWLLDKRILNALSRKFMLAIFTGRPKDEALYALKTASTIKFFKLLIASEDTINKKPFPDGLNIIIDKLKSNSAVYVGDSIDDLHAARSANIEFIGVLPPGLDKNKLRAILRDNGAKIILENINTIAQEIK